MAKPTSTGTVRKYFRSNKKFPHIWCPGCGHGIILGSLVRAIDELGLPKDDICLVAGIGCSSRAPVYVDFDTVHTLHGRAIGFATGIKLFKPRLKVIVITGDGDATAIGGNHFIHAARRNIDLMVLVFNNNIYGMTGGQYSPTTPVGMKATTAPYGQVERPFDISELAVAAGASFVARTTAYHAQDLIKYIKAGISKKGFSVVEAMSNCFTTFGRRNRLGDPVKMIEGFKENAVQLDKWQTLKEEEKAGKFSVGIFADKDLPEYCAEYDRLIGKCRENELGGAQ